MLAQPLKCRPSPTLHLLHLPAPDKQRTMNETVSGLRCPRSVLRPAAIIGCEVCSALAQVRLTQGRRVEALKLSSRAIELIERDVPAEEPEGSYLIHAEVLQGAGDPSAAGGTIKRAWELLE